MSIWDKYYNINEWDKYYNINENDLKIYLKLFFF